MASVQVGVKRTLALCATMSAAISLTAGTSVEQPAQELAKRTVWDGVYTETQARRGEARYETTCRSCHRDGPRRGEAFLRDWIETDVESVFRRIKTSMPPGAPSSLSDAEYVDIVAYMLRVNEFPAGADELRADAIRSIRIEGRNGPEPAPNFALVRTVGCLTQGPDAAWVLSDASEPVRTKNPAASTDEELKASQDVGLGIQTIHLLNVYPRPDPYKGHKIEAKGLLIRNPDGDRINVTSVQTLAPECKGLP